jgi:predicted DNA-binding transcriptional regulator AlpA
MAEDLLTQKQVAQRWALSERTLERWRCTGEGPVHIKLGCSVRYRMADIEAFEQAVIQKRLRSCNGLPANATCARSSLNYYTQPNPESARQL